ncbi:MAG: phosphomannomutase, partial [Candidatus Nitrosomaritimum aestuariumsis]
ELPKILEQQELQKTSIGHEEKIDSTYLEHAQNIVGQVENAPKIAVDIGGGAAKEYAPRLLEKLGCNVEVLNSDLNNCSRGPDPTSDSLSDLVSATSNKDIGFAFDLDGDRLVVVKNGKKQTPDVTLGLGVAKSLDLGYKNFVLSIDTSVSVEKFIKQNGGTVKRSKVGEANVIDLMLQSNAQAGGEGSSAGFVLPEFNYCRDGILTSGLIASMLGTSQFNDILSFMENYIQIRDKTSVDSQYHDKVIEKVAEKFGDNYSEVITLDGIKGIVDEDSWVLIRKSNTEDIIRISAESNDQDKCNRIVKESTELVKQCYEEIR